MISPKPALFLTFIFLTLGGLVSAETCPEGLTKCIENNVSNEYQVCIGGVFYQYKCPAALVCQDFPASIWYGNTPTNVLCAARPYGKRPAAESTTTTATPPSTTQKVESKKMKLLPNTSKKSSKATPVATSAKPVYTTEKIYKPTSTKSKPKSTKAPASPSGGGGGGGGSFTGEGTYYDVGLGSCGDVNSNDEHVAALNAPQMQNPANPNKNPICGRKARVHGPIGSVTVTIVDTCPPCKWGDVDLSPTAFDKIAKREQGRVPIRWEWV